MRIQISNASNLYVSKNTLLFLYPELRSRLNEIPRREDQGVLKYDAVDAVKVAMQIQAERPTPLQPDTHIFYSPTHTF
jgi:hypothetical protein